MIALINSNGEIYTTLVPAYPDMYEDGAQYGEAIAKHIPHQEDGCNFMETKYYDFVNNIFKDRIPRPSAYHRWSKNQEDWYFDRDSAIELVRKERTLKLNLSDWTQVPDSPLSAEQKAAWQTYRQALRDLPSTIPQDIESIAEILWPSPPS